MNKNLKLAILELVNHKYIPLDAKFYADFEFEVKILFLPTHSREKRVLKNLRGWIQKILIALNWKLNSDSKYIHMSRDSKSQAVESLMF